MPGMRGLQSVLIGVLLAVSLSGADETKASPSKAPRPQGPLKQKTTLPPVQTPPPELEKTTSESQQGVKTPPAPVKPETIFPPVKKPPAPVRPKTTFPPVKTPQAPVRPETTFPPVKKPPAPVRPETIVPPVQTPQVPLRPETTFPPVKIPLVPVKTWTTFPPVQTLQPVTQQTISTEYQSEEDGEQTGSGQVGVTSPALTTDSDQILSQHPQKECKTRWFNQDDPSGIGDNEILIHILDKNPDAVCFIPTAIEVQTLDGTPASETGQNFFVENVVHGFSCINHMQGKGGKCLDYKVRFTCPPSFCSGGQNQITPGPGIVVSSAPSPTLEQDQTSPQTTVQEVPIICKTRWLNQDDPSGDGDHELLADLQRENPQEICSEPSDIEVQTVGGIPASETGQNFIVNDATNGFSCINEEQGKGQRCYDYQVRFTCPQWFCSGGEIQDPSESETVTPSASNFTLKPVQNSSSSPVKGQDQSVPVTPVTTSIDIVLIQTTPEAPVPVCKTKWLNRDNPSATGDYELIYYFRREYPNAICPKPIALEVQTVDGVPAQQTGQKFARNDVVNGFACLNADQGKGGFCFDYKVRFTCPPSFCSGGGPKHPVRKTDAP